MAGKFTILSALQALLLLSFLIHLVMLMPHEKVAGVTPEEPVIMVYSTDEKEIRIKNGSSLYSIPTPSDMRLVAYDPKHAELYLTFRWGPASPEEAGGESVTIYRAKLSDDKADHGVSAFANPSSSKGDPRHSLDSLTYDDVDEKLYFCDHR